MQYDEFVGRVQNRARLASSGEAVRATRATLETLAERLAGNEAQNLAAQLPREFGDYLQVEEKGQRFTVREFFDRVARREDLDMPVSAHHARAVLSVVSEAVSPGEMDDVREQLPEEYHQLFEAGSEGELDL